VVRSVRLPDYRWQIPAALRLVLSSTILAYNSGVQEGTAEEESDFSARVPYSPRLNHSELSVMSQCDRRTISVA